MLIESNCAGFIFVNFLKYYLRLTRYHAPSHSATLGLQPALGGGGGLEPALARSGGGGGGGGGTLFGASERKREEGDEIWVGLVASLASM